LGAYLALIMTSLEPDNTPIVSSLLEEEPDIRDLLQEFIDRLPETIEAIRNTLGRRDKDKLAIQIHSLKGVSGNYGYQCLYELCQKMELEIHANRLNTLSDMLNRADKIIDRIRLGLTKVIPPINRDRHRGVTE